MAAPTVSVPSLDFSTPEDPIEYTRRRPRTAWPATIRIDQRAIEQARKELGADADAHAVLARAQEIADEIKGELGACAFEDQHCDCRELATVHQLGTDFNYCTRHFQQIAKEAN